MGQIDTAYELIDRISDINFLTALFTYNVSQVLKRILYILDANLGVSKVIHNASLKTFKTTCGHLYFSQPKEGEKHEMGIAAHR
jgi:sortase (surface protein transpeptidase)